MKIEELEAAERAAEEAWKATLEPNATDWRSRIIRAENAEATRKALYAKSGPALLAVVRAAQEHRYLTNTVSESGERLDAALAALGEVKT